MTFTLDSRLEADTIPVGDLALSSVLLLNDARFPWFVLVPRVAGASELTDLSEEQSAQLMQEIRIATRVMQVMASLPGIANFLVPQELSVLHADGRTGEMERLVRTASTAVALLSAAALAGLALLGRPLLDAAFGEAYAGGWTILLILAAGTLWDTASGSAGYVLQMSGNHLRLLWLTLGAAALKLALSVALGPIWGGHGIALATARARARSHQPAHDGDRDPSTPARHGPSLADHGPARVGSGASQSRRCRACRGCLSRGSGAHATKWLGTVRPRAELARPGEGRIC